MGKVSLKDLDSKTSMSKKKSKSSSNKYLKPGALARQRCSIASATKSCKSPLMLSPQVSVVKLVRPMQFADLQVESNNFKKSPLMLSPVSIATQSTLAWTPKTPQDVPCNSESQFECLPMDLLVNIICHLHHDQLKTVFHVSERIRKATMIARHFYFNFATPAPMPINRWLLSKGDGNASPVTPKAPKPGPRPPCRSNLAEIRQISAALFQDETAFPSSRCAVPSVLESPTLFKLMAPKQPRVLFYEDELCQAVAKNNLT